MEIQRTSAAKRLCNRTKLSWSVAILVIVVASVAWASPHRDAETGVYGCSRMELDATAGRISLSCIQASMQAIADWVEVEAGLDIMVSPPDLLQDRTLRAEFKDLTIDQALDEIFSDFNRVTASGHRHRGSTTSDSGHRTRVILFPVGEPPPQQPFSSAVDDPDRESSPDSGLLHDLLNRRKRTLSRLRETDATERQEAVDELRIALIEMDQIGMAQRIGSTAQAVALVEALATLDPPAALEAIAEWMSDPGREKRHLAGVIAAGTVARAESVNQLVPLLNSERAPLRQAAANSLVQIGSPEAMRPLFETDPDADRADTRVVATAILRHGSPDDQREVAVRLSGEDALEQQSARQVISDYLSASEGEGRAD